jgi:hypothetical protein
MVMTLQRFGALERVEIPQLDRHVGTARSCKMKNMIFANFILSYFMVL